MSDALMIGGTQHWGGGDDKFGIGIAYGLQGSLFHSKIFVCETI